MPKVSILMPAYNHQDYVGIAIESVLNQSFSDFELLIGDDASPDNTVKVIRQYEDPRIKLFTHEHNLGATFNHRHLLEIAAGEYIALINSDDVWLEGKLEKQVKYLDNHPQIGMCSCWANFIDENGKSLAVENNVFNQPNRTQSEWIEYFFTKGNCICHPGVLIRRTLYEKLNYYNLAMRQLPDFEMWIRVIKHTSFFIFQEPLVEHRRFIFSGENTSAPKISNSIRDVMESYYILTEFFEDMPDELFLDAFKKYFRYKDANSKEELCCEKYFLLLDGHYYMAKIHTQVAIMFMLKNYTTNVAKILREKYNYTLQDFHEVSCQVDLLGLLPQNFELTDENDFSPETYIIQNKAKALSVILFKKSSVLYKLVRKIYFLIKNK